MNLPRLPCAGKLGNCPKHLKRFSFTCLYCRWRRMHYGKWTLPPFWIDYTIPWFILRYIVLNQKTGEVKVIQTWKTLKIDPRGHLVKLRCAIIATILRLAKPFSCFYWYERGVGLGLIKASGFIRRKSIALCELFASISL